MTKPTIYIECPDCLGSGTISKPEGYNGSRLDDCPTCKGTGRVKELTEKRQIKKTLL